MLNPPKAQQRRAAWLTAAFYAAIFAGFGAQLPYWPVWLEAWGLDEAAIGYFLGAATIARVAGATLLPALADAFAIRRWVLGVSGLIAAGLILLHLDVSSEATLLALTVLAAIAMAPSMPLGEALGLRAADRFGFSYAPVRAAGSVAFLMANLALGWALDRVGIGVLVWWVAGCFAVAALLGLLHPGGGAAASVPDRARRGDVFRLLAHPVFLLFALTAALGQASHAVYYAYSVLDWRQEGIPATTIGALWAFGVVTETLLLLGPGRHLMAHVRPAHGLAIAAIAGIFRWGLMAASPALTWLWPLQALHALTFAVGHLGAMAFVAAAIPQRLNGTAQGLKAGIIGGGMHALALAGAAAVVATSGIGGAYLMASAISGAALIGALVLAGVWRGERILPDNTD